MQDQGFTPQEIAFFEEGEQLADNTEPRDDFSDLDAIPASQLH